VRDVVAVMAVERQRDGVERVAGFAHQRSHAEHVSVSALHGQSGMGGRRQVTEVVLRVDQEQVQVLGQCGHGAPRGNKVWTRYGT